MPYEYIISERKEHVTIITMNRPEVMNALHPPASLEMERALDEFCGDNDAWVCIITGSGNRAFSTGNDLKYQNKNFERFIKEVEKMKCGFGGLTLRFDCFKPVIAAVNGKAFGGGLELALACDIVIAADTATFGLTEARVGLVPFAGGIFRLPRQIPHRIAMGMLMTGERISAEKAMAYGLVNEVVPPEQLMEAAERWADEILKSAPLAVRAIKEAVATCSNMSIKDATAESYNLPGVQRLFQSEDMTEGPRAFAEKRKPNWKAQ